MAQNALMDREDWKTEESKDERVPPTAGEFLHDLTSPAAGPRDGERAVIQNGHLTLLRYAAAPVPAALPQRASHRAGLRWYDWGVAALLLSSGAGVLACLFGLN